MAELDDPARLSELDVVALGVDADAVLDACVEEAAHLADAPIAFVGLVMRHVQLLRAHRGLPPELAASRATSRGSSFCQIVVREEAPLVVEDAARDPRVPQELVTHMGICAYVGVPVRVHGQAIGTLCVVDIAPRRFEPVVVSMLGSLGAVVGKRLAALERPSPEADAPPPPAGAPATPAGRVRRLLESAGLLVRALEEVGPIVARMQAIEEEPRFTGEPELRRDLRAASAWYAGVVAAAREVSVEVSRLSGQSPELPLEQVTLDARALERELTEAGPLIRLAEAGLEGRLEPAAVSRAAWVTREALGFHVAALAAARRLGASLGALVGPSGAVI
jgi:GAF domain